MKFKRFYLEYKYARIICQMFESILKTEYIIHLNWYKIKIDTQSNKTFYTWYVSSHPWTLDSNGLRLIETRRLVRESKLKLKIWRSMDHYLQSRVWSQEILWNLSLFQVLGFYEFYLNFLSSLVMMKIFIFSRIVGDIIASLKIP